MTGVRRPAALAAVLVVLAACSSGGGKGAGGDDPLAPVATTAAAHADSGYGPPASLGTIGPDVTESSGLVASRRNPGTYWTHNDSGDGPFLYCLTATAASCGVWRVTGADAFDWEDIAAGPGPDPQTPYLYAGDIGDNLGNRADVLVYRVPEPGPATPVPTKSAPAATEKADVLRLRYPDGPHNAEALLVHPTTGDLYIVAKESAPGVYVARAPISATAPTTLTKVATLSNTTFATGRSVVTGGDISPDGQRVALCNYVEGIEYRLPAGAPSFDAVWQQQPVFFDLGRRVQGEAIAYRLDGKALLATSEGGPATIPSPLTQVEQK